VARASGSVWLVQARSDLDSAARVFDEQNASTYCHTIAKYQQTVEKSVKGVVAALHDTGILAAGPSYTHGLDNEITDLKTLPHNHRKSVIIALVSQIKRFLDVETRSGLKIVVALAPKKPASGELEPRNTEYPFQRGDGTWIAPATEDAFTLAEVEEFRLIARRTYHWAENIVFSARLIKSKG
jgi:hypothetical protein